MVVGMNLEDDTLREGKRGLGEDFGKHFPCGLELSLRGRVDREALLPLNELDDELRDF